MKFYASACNFIQKETLSQVLYCEFCEISKNAFFTEHLRTTASLVYLRQTHSSFLNLSFKFLQP